MWNKVTNFLLDLSFCKQLFLSIDCWLLQIAIYHIDDLPFANKRNEKGLGKTQKMKQILFITKTKTLLLALKICLVKECVTKYKIPMIHKTRKCQLSLEVSWFWNYAPGVRFAKVTLVVNFFIVKEPVKTKIEEFWDLWTSPQGVKNIS
jgi:hypothetical protein